MNIYKQYLLGLLVIGFILWNENLLDFPIWLILLAGIHWAWTKSTEETSTSSIISTCYCAELVKDFADLAKNLAPPPNYLIAGRQAAHCVFEQLKQNGHTYDLKFGKTKITGSIGKDTGISYQFHNGTMKRPDFDLVVFLNEKQPPFKDELECIANLIRKIPNVRDVTTKEISIKFVYKDNDEGEIKFDLLPAENSVPNTHENPDAAHAASQLALLDISDKQEKALRRQRKINKDENRLASSSFSESAVSFVKAEVEDDYVLKVVRLAKFWNSNIIWSKYIPARSCMIELIAIEAQIDKSRGCLISGFRRFLESMQNFGSLRVSIGATENHNNEAFLKENFKRSSKIIVLDPSNPYNNLADGLGSDVIGMFQTQARKTLKALDELKGRSGYESVQNAMDHIFSNK